MSLWQKLTADQKILAATVLISLLLVPLYALVNSSTSSESEGPAARSGAVDTMIPKGYVLVPLEVENYEAVDSILGHFGVVDLFQRQTLVARNVRILRAPQNPSHFAVLVREGEVKEVLQNGGSFSVVIKPRQKDGTEFVKQSAKKRRKFVFEGG